MQKNLQKRRADELHISGIYRHYKGALYQVLNVVLHSETLEELVYYRCLYDNPSSPFWVRPIDLFLNPLPDGRPRFEWLPHAIPPEKIEQS